MTIKQTLIVASIAALGFAAAPAAAVTNLIKNGSFELGPLGNGPVPFWTKTNTPTGALGQGDARASVIGYNNTNPYPTGAFGESVTPDNSVSLSPDAVGGKAAYFVGDKSVNETWSQLSYVGVGNYRIGFSYYLPANGLSNAKNASLQASILGVPVVSTAITNASTGLTWFNVSGVANFAVAGNYITNFIYNSNGFPAKDIVVDRVYAIRTIDPATVFIPPTPTIVPEPESWALMIIGFGLIGVAARGRKTIAVAA
jgi:hypothetical protein